MKTQLSQEKALLRISAEKSNYIRVNKKYEHLFPNYNITLEILSEYSPTRVNFISSPRGKWLNKNHLASLFEKYRLCPGNIFILQSIEPMKKYRLEIVK